jgi:hypothetical protein
VDQWRKFPLMTKGGSLPVIRVEMRYVSFTNQMSLPSGRFLI